MIRDSLAARSVAETRKRFATGNAANTPVDSPVKEDFQLNDEASATTEEAILQLIKELTLLSKARRARISVAAPRRKWGE